MYNTGEAGIIRNQSGRAGQFTQGIGDHSENYTRKFALLFFFLSFSSNILIFLNVKLLCLALLLLLFSR